MLQLCGAQMQLGCIPIEQIEINVECREDILAMLLDLRHIFADVELRFRVFALMEENKLPGVNYKICRPGMHLYNIFVLAALKQRLNYNFDRIHDLVSEHKT